MRHPSHSALALLACSVAAFAISARAWLRPGTLLGGGEAPDWQGTLWVYWWAGEALTSGRSPATATEVFVPIGHAPLSQYNLLDGLLAWPLVRWLGPETGYNLFIVACLATSAWAMWRLATHAGASGLSATIASAGLLTSGFLTTEVVAGRVTQAMLAPLLLGLWSLDALASERRSSRAVLAGLLVGLTALGYWYYGLFLVIGGAVLWAARWGQWGRRELSGLALAAAIAAMMCLPFVAALAVDYTSLPGVTGGAVAGSSHLALAAPNGLWPGAWIWSGTGRQPDRGASLLLLLLAPLAFRGARPWRWALLALTGWVLSWGPYLVAPNGDPTPIPGPMWLLMQTVPFLERLWWPDRALPLALAGMGVLAALGADQLATGRRRLAWTAAVVLAMGVEASVRYGIFPYPAEPARRVETRLYDQLDGALLTTPVLGERGATDGRFNLWLQVHHGLPITGGLGDVVEGHAPLAYRSFVADNTLMSALTALTHGPVPAATISPDDVQALLDAGITWVVVDPVTFAPQHRRQAVRQHERLLTRVFGRPDVRAGPSLAWRLEVPVAPISLPAEPGYLDTEPDTRRPPVLRRSR